VLLKRSDGLQVAFFENLEVVFLQASDWLMTTVSYDYIHNHKANLRLESGAGETEWFYSLRANRNDDGDERQRKEATAAKHVASRILEGTLLVTSRTRKL
jgi:hypothetical protein